MLASLYRHGLDFLLFADGLGAAFPLKAFVSDCLAGCLMKLS